jgi:myo-inositol-1(or 4)-monophosphatase
MILKGSFFGLKVPKNKSLHCDIPNGHSAWMPTMDPTDAKWVRQSILRLLILLVLHSSSSVVSFQPPHSILQRGVRRNSWSMSNTSEDPALLDQILQVAVEAAKKAGSIILDNSGGSQVTQRKANSRDLLTLIDPLCERAIRETVSAAFPSHEFLGEEDVAPGPEASAAALADKLSRSDWLWIVDPIDGTTNFVHGMPLCLPSIAVAFQGQVMVGVIYDVHRDELFTAVRGRGAFLNQLVRLPVVGVHDPIIDTLGDAVVAMGAPPGEQSMRMSILGTAALMPKVRTLRMLGSAALMLAWVAQGRLTAYWEYDLSSWGK